MVEHSYSNFAIFLYLTFTAIEMEFNLKLKIILKYKPVFIFSANY